MGDEVIVELGRASTAVDHIMALISLGVSSYATLPPTSIAFSRNLHTALSMILGVMHELSGVLNGLRQRVWQRTGGELPALESIREIARRWAKSDSRVLRNQLAFHLGDSKMHLAGLTKLAERGETITLTQCDGGTYARDARSPFGLQLLLTGLEIDDADFRAIFEQLLVDMGEVGLAMQEVQMALLRSAGVELGERVEPTASPTDGTNCAISTRR